MEKIEAYNKDCLSTVAGTILNDVINSENVSTLLVAQDITKELASQLIETKIIKPIENAVKDVKVVQDFFDSDFGTKEDAKLKKILATAAVVAKHTGVLPIPNDAVSPQAIASIVDEGLNQIKVAHKVATKLIAPDKAVDKLVDLATARVATAIDMAVPAIKQAANEFAEKTVPAAIEVACAYVENAFPPARVVTPIVRSATPYITEKSKQLINKGIDIVAVGAKKVVSEIGNKVKAFGKKLLSCVFG